MDEFRRSREIKKLNDELVDLEKKMNLIHGIRSKVDMDQPLLIKQQSLIIPEISSIVEHRKFLLPTIPEHAVLEYTEKTKHLRRLKRNIVNKVSLTGSDKDLLEEVLKSLENYLKMQRERLGSELKKIVSEGSILSGKFTRILAIVLMYWVYRAIFF